MDAGDACEYSVLPLCCSPGLFRVWASIGGSVTSDMLLVLCEDVNDQFPESLDPSTIDAPLRPARLPIGGRVWLEGPSDGRREDSHGVGLIVAIMSDSCEAAEPTTMETGCDGLGARGRERRRFRWNLRTGWTSYSGRKLSVRRATTRTEERKRARP